MKIAFLHPWRNAAENQGYQSLRIAAERIGHELIHCGNSEDVEASGAEFVLAAASTQPKLNDVPHYGVIHEPRDRFLTNQSYFQNLLTYDGHFTISDNLERFLRDVCNAVGRPEEVGYYYNTCQRQELFCDLETIIRRRGLLITYFGTNWDKRRQGFFKQLSEAPGVQICGPQHSWPDINPAAYGGTTDFDGNSVQGRYAANGIGLCMLSDLHLRDDIISNRIFEVTSVGAIAVCCDIPWIRKNFGDTVYYYDQNLPDRFLQKAILRIRDEIYKNPTVAIEKAKRARKIFEERFAAEVLLANTVAYHQRTQRARHDRLVYARGVYQPLISVIIRCGGRTVDFVKNAVCSIDRQTYGRFEVILVRHGDLDLSTVVSAQYTNIVSIRAVDCLAGSRSTTLWKGLSCLTGEYFSVLDDDDLLFSNHFERLFEPFPTAPLTGFFAYAGCISEHREPRDILGGGQDRRELFQFGIKSNARLTEVSAAFASNCFVASTDLLNGKLLNDPRMDTAEDSYLILSLIAQATPRFCHAVTNLHSRGRADQSGFENHPRRFEDELTLNTRLFSIWKPALSMVDRWEQLREFWETRKAFTVPAIESRPDRIIYRKVDFCLSVADGFREQVSTGFKAAGSNSSGQSLPVDTCRGVAHVHTPEHPWHYGVELVLSQPDQSTSHGEYLLVVEVLVERGPAGVGLLEPPEREFVFRIPLYPEPRVQEVHIPFRGFDEIGRFVIQNWDKQGPAIARLLSMKIYA